MGLPVFVLWGVPILQLMSALKLERPWHAGLAGAITAMTVNGCVYLEHSEGSWSSMVYLVSTSLWAALAGWVYRYTQNLAKEAQVQSTETTP